MRRLIQRSVLILLIAIGVIWFWNSYRSLTFEVVTVQNISQNEINIVNSGGRERTMSVPIDLRWLFEINQEYTVSYDKRILDKHRLRKISVSSD